MGIFIIVIICAVAYILISIFKYVFLLAYTKRNYQIFKELSYDYPRKLLYYLRMDLQTSITRLNIFIECDNEMLQKFQDNPRKTAFWQQNLLMDGELLTEYQGMLQEVEAEINRREFFNSQW